MKKFFKRVGSRLLNFLYNEDRAIASLALGAKAEDTLSGKIGEHQGNPIVHPAAVVLDHIQKDHVENAEKHEDYLDKCNDEYYSHKERGQAVEPVVVGIVIVCAVVYYAGVGIGKAGKWVGHEATAATSKVVHLHLHHKARK